MSQAVELSNDLVETGTLVEFVGRAPDFAPADLTCRVAVEHVVLVMLNLVGARKFSFATRATATKYDNRF